MPMEVADVAPMLPVQLLQCFSHVTPQRLFCDGGPHDRLACCAVEMGFRAAPIIVGTQRADGC